MLLGIFQSLSNFPISTVLTVIAVALLALSVLFGIIRGFRKSLFYTIFYLIAFAGFLLGFPTITKIIVNMAVMEPIAEFARSTLSNINGADLSSMFVSGTASYTFLLAMVSFVVQIALCIGFIVIFEVFYKIIIWLFWVLIGKRMFKTKIKKRGRIIRKSKQRIFGGLVGLIPGAMSVIMLFVPISGIFSIASSFTRVDKKESVSFGTLLDEEDYNALQKTFNAYDESIPGMIFNLSTSKDGRSLDLVLLDRFISVKIDDKEFNIRKDIERLGQFATNIASTGITDVIASDTLTPNQLLEAVDGDEELIEDAFQSLGDVEFIDLILNTGVEYLDKSRLVDSSLELASDSVDYASLSKLDWSSEFAQMGKIVIATVELLDALPEANKDLPISELKFTAEMLDEMDGHKVEDALTNFADELFGSELINEASTAGLALLFNNEGIKEIVGEVDKEELKKIVLKDEVGGVIKALSSMINIGTSNLKNMDLKALSSQSEELHNIINGLLGLGLYELVETNVLNYVIDNHIANNENTSKFIDVEELRNSVNSDDEANRLDIKKELNAIVDTFARLGKETKLFDLEEVEDENAKLNLEALNSVAIGIVNDHISDSKQIQKFVDKMMEGALVPALFEQEEYETLINKPGFCWYDIKNENKEVVTEGELSVLTKLLAAIEDEYKDHPDGKSFSIFSMINSEEKEFTLAMLNGLGAKVDGEDDLYILDTSMFASEMIATVLEDAGEGNDLLGGIKDNPKVEGHYGREMGALSRMLAESGIIENKYESIDFANLADEFQTLSAKKITAIGNNIGDSEIMKEFITNKLGPSEDSEEDGILSQETIDEMENWSNEKWKQEFDILAEVMFDEVGGLSDGKEEVALDELSEGYDEINYHQLNVISENIEDSVIIKELFKTSLENGGFDVADDINWKSEVEVIRDIVGSETKIVNGSDVTYLDMNINDLSSFDYLRPETLTVISYNINKSSIIKDTLIDPMRGIMGVEEGSEAPTDPLNPNYKLYPENWTDDEWSYEMKSLAYVSYPLAEPNTGGTLKEGYPEEYTYLDINNPNIEGSIKLQVLEHMLGGYDEEPSLLARIFRRIFRSTTPDIDNYDYGIHKSEVLQKLFRDALSKSYEVDFDTYEDNDYYYEVKAFIGVLSNENAKLYEIENGEKVINFETLKDKLTGSDTGGSKKIKLTVLEACKDNVAGSRIMQQTMKDNLEDLMNTPLDESTFATHKYNYDSWTGDTWTKELTSLYLVAETIAVEEDGEKYVQLEGDIIGDKIKYKTIRTLKDNSNSEILRHALRETFDTMINGVENSTEDNKTISCLPIYVSNDASEAPRYMGWNDNQWKYEMNVLYEVVDYLAQQEYEKGNCATKEDAEISIKDNPSTPENESLSGRFTSFDKVFLQKVTSAVYGTVEGVSGEKFNSYILQTQLVDSMEQVMNSGDKDTGVMALKNRYRKIYPLAGDFNDPSIDYVPNELLLDRYSATNPEADDSIGEWWANEMDALFQIVDEKFDDGDEIPAGDMKFNEINIKVLDIIRDTVEGSYILQSAMRSTIEGLINQDGLGYTETETWSPKKWATEMVAVRDISKTLATDITLVTSSVQSKVRFNNSLVTKRSVNSLNIDTSYIEKDWIIREDNDSNYEINLDELNLKNSDEGEGNDDSVSIDTMYYVSKYADCSEIIRKMSRSHIAEILELDTTPGVEPEFVNRWLNDSYPGLSVSEDVTANRWRYEMEALFNIANKMTSEAVNKNNGITTGFIMLNAHMFDVLHVDVFDVISGGFTSEHLIDDTSDDHGYVANRGSIKYQSELVNKMLTKSLVNDSNKDEVKPSEWNDERWAYEIYAIKHVVSPLQDANGKVDVKNLSFDDGVNMEVLNNLSDIIHRSTYMQNKLNSALFTNRSTYTEYPESGYSTSVNQWNDEIEALYETMNGTKYVEEINGKDVFKFDNLDFSQSVDMKVLANLSKVINKSTYMQYKLDEALFTDDVAAYPSVKYISDSELPIELGDNYTDIEFSEYLSKKDNEQWNKEIQTIYEIVNGTDYVTKDANGNDVFEYNTLSSAFDDSKENIVIDVNLLKHIGDNINYSTYLQSKLEGTMEGLVTTNSTDEFYILDREEYFEKDFRNSSCTHDFESGLWDHECSICGYIKDYHLEEVVPGELYRFDLQVKYNDFYYHAWSVELKTIFGIITDPKSGLINEVDNTVDIKQIEDKLHELNVNVINVTSDKLDEFGHDAYHSSNIIRLNLIKPLEKLAYGEKDFDSEAQIRFDNSLFDNGFKWIDIPLTSSFAEHEFTFENNSGTYNITTSNLHRYDGDKSFVINSDNSVTIHLQGWESEIAGVTFDIYDLEVNLEAVGTNTRDEVVYNRYIAKGLDRDGNEVNKYMMDINTTTGKGYWYCIVNYSDLHEVATFFKLLGAETLEDARGQISLSLLLDERIVSLREESYYINLIFTNLAR